MELARVLVSAQSLLPSALASLRWGLQGPATLFAPGQRSASSAAFDAASQQRAYVQPAALDAAVPAHADEGAQKDVAQPLPARPRLMAPKRRLIDPAQHIPEVFGHIHSTGERARRSSPSPP